MHGGKVCGGNQEAMKITGQVHFPRPWLEVHWFLTTRGGMFHECSIDVCIGWACWSLSQVTVHLSLRACDHWNLKSQWWKRLSLSHLSPLYTRGWVPKGSRKFEWMKNLRGVLHGMKWIMFHGLLDFASSPPQIWGGSNTRLGVVDTSKFHKLQPLIYYNLVFGKPHMK